MHSAVARLSCVSPGHAGTLIGPAAACIVDSSTRVGKRSGANTLRVAQWAGLGTLEAAERERVQPTDFFDEDVGASGCNAGSRDHERDVRRVFKACLFRPLVVVAEGVPVICARGWAQPESRGCLSAGGGGERTAPQRDDGVLRERRVVQLVEHPADVGVGIPAPSTHSSQMADQGHGGEDAEDAPLVSHERDAQYARRSSSAFHSGKVVLSNGNSAVIPGRPSANGAPG